MVVFEPGMEGQNDEEYKKIHEDYKNLVRPQGVYSMLPIHSFEILFPYFKGYP